MFLLAYRVALMSLLLFYMLLDLRYASCYDCQPIICDIFYKYFLLVYLFDFAYGDFTTQKLFVFFDVVFCCIWILNYSSKVFPHTQVIKESICVVFQYLFGFVLYIKISDSFGVYSWVQYEVQVQFNLLSSDYILVFLYIKHCVLCSHTSISSLRVSHFCLQ